MCSCFGIKVCAAAFVVFYFYCTSLSFRAVREYAVEVILHLCLRVCWFGLCLLSFLFLSSVKESFSFSLFHLTRVSLALVTDPSNNGAGALIVLLCPFLYAVADSFAVRRYVFSE